MTLEKINVIDAVGIDKDSGELVLSILDSWDWGDELSHLLALQSKLNAYFNFVESGQILEVYPEASGRAIRINVINRYTAPESCKTLLQRAAAVTLDLGIAISQQDHSGA